MSNISQVVINELFKTLAHVVFFLNKFNLYNSFKNKKK